MKASEKRRREARTFFVENPTSVTFAALAKKCRMSTPGVFRWQRLDTDKGKPSWTILRKDFWAKKNEEKEVKELVKMTKNEVADMLNYEKQRIEGIQILTKLRAKLANDDILNKLTDQAKIRDVLDLLKQIEKTAVGLGFADKIVVIGAVKPDESIEAEYEILED